MLEIVRWAFGEKDEILYIDSVLTCRVIESHFAGDESCVDC